MKRKLTILFFASFVLFSAWFLSGCASSVQYDYVAGKWEPVSKMTNTGVGVEADHKNKTIKNGVINLPTINK